MALKKRRFPSTGPVRAAKKTEICAVPLLQFRFERKTVTAPRANNARRSTGQDHVTGGTSVHHERNLDVHDELKARTDTVRPCVPISRISARVGRRPRRVPIGPPYSK